MAIQHLPKSRRFPGGGWLVRYRDADNRTRRKTFALKQKAQEFEDEVRTDIRRGDYLDPRRAQTPLGQLAERWYEAKEKQSGTVGRPTPATLAGYRSVLDTHLIPDDGGFTGWPVKKIQASDVEALLAEAGVSVKTQRNILRVLSPIMKLAVRDGMIRVNPCSMVELVGNGEDHEEMRFLTAEQVQDLAEEITSPYGTVVYFAAYTGMRAGEIVGLRVKNLDLMKPRVYVKESATAVNGTIHTGRTKNKKNRMVALPSFLVDPLMKQVAGRDQKDYVFPGANGRPMRHGNFYNRHFRPAVKRLVDRGDWPEELRGLRFHDLRHTCASLLAKQGVQPLAVSRQLGHSSIQITIDRYTHLFKDDGDLVTNALDAIHQAAAPPAPGKVARLRPQA